MAAVGDKNVRRLDVPVNDALRVGSVQSIGDLHSQIEHRLDLHGLAADPAPERLPSSNSMAMKVRPSASSISYTVQMFG